MSFMENLSIPLKSDQPMVLLLPVAGITYLSDGKPLSEVLNIRNMLQPELHRLAQGREGACLVIAHC